jgi:3D (Asp-Asp-Asp) domain-containing protein
MKLRINELICLILLTYMPMTAHTDGPPPAPVKPIAKMQEADTQSALARITVYWAKGDGTDYWSRRFRSATGVRLRTGHCAVDPRRIPYFSHVEINGVGSFLAVDTGTDVRLRSAARRAGRSKKERQAIVVDVFYPTRAEALAAAEELPKFAMVSWRE